MSEATLREMITRWRTTAANYNYSLGREVWGFCADELEKALATPSATQGVAQEWRTIICGLPIIRKLLSGQDVTLETFKVNLIPDDVLFNAKPAAAQAAQGAGTVSAKQVLVGPGSGCQATVLPYYDRLTEGTSETCHRPLPCIIHDRQPASAPAKETVIMREHTMECQAQVVQHSQNCPCWCHATPVVQPEAQVMEIATPPDEELSHIINSFIDVPSTEPNRFNEFFHSLERYVTRECNAVRLAFGEQVAKWIIEKSGLKNCHEWPTEAHAVTCKTALAESIRALAAKEQP